MATTLSLPGPVLRGADAQLASLLFSDSGAASAFSAPPGEPALAAPESVSWAVFKNPLTVFIGGVAAVLLELADPRVRSGVWQHTTFREKPLQRLQRTGWAAMMTVYGPRTRAEAMIGRVAHLHEGVRGVTPAGVAYQASDPALLEWVHATACFGILQAHGSYVEPITEARCDAFYAEAQTAARLYGVRDPPGSQAAVLELFKDRHAGLEPSDVVIEFLQIVKRMPALPAMLRPVQGWLVDAAVAIVPADLRHRLGLGGALAPWQRRLVSRAAAAADRLVLPSHPAVQACRRLGLADDYLYRR